MFEGINIFAVLVAAATSFLLGELWYSKLMFLNPWTRAMGQPPRGKHPGIVFPIAYALNVVAALVLARFLGPQPEFEYALWTGFLVGAGFVATTFGVNYLFSGLPFRLWLINSGYHVIEFMIFGAVLGLWPK